MNWTTKPISMWKNPGGASCLYPVHMQPGWGRGWLSSGADGWAGAPLPGTGSSCAYSHLAPHIINFLPDSLDSNPLHQGTHLSEEIHHSVLCSWAKLPELCLALSPPLLGCKGRPCFLLLFCCCCPPPESTMNETLRNRPSFDPRNIVRLPDSTGLQA